VYKNIFFCVDSKTKTYLTDKMYLNDNFIFSFPQEMALIFELSFDYSYRLNFHTD
jgi:hypothetical protein